MLLEYAEIENDMCPTPKQITAGCALSLEFPEESLEEVKRIVREERVEIRGIYSKIGDQYVNMEL